jgi:hypothetical protein
MKTKDAFKYVYSPRDESVAVRFLKFFHPRPFMALANLIASVLLACVWVLILIAIWEGK